MHWFATHRIVSVRQGEAPAVIEVMAMDMGVDHPGPGRYALYTSEQWGETEPEWSMDMDGRLWFKNAALPPDVTATLEGVWA